MNITADNKHTEKGLQNLFAILFVKQWVAPAEIARVLGIPLKEVDSLIDNIEKHLSKYTPLTIAWADGKISICTRPEFAHLIRSLNNPPAQRKVSLSQASLETLAVIAYKQPITKAEIDKLRGCDCESALNTLKKHKLIKTLGNINLPGSPATYTTTNDFLKAFGLKSLQNLPDPHYHEPEF